MLQQHEGQADEKDVPILAAAAMNGAQYLVTDNARHFDTELSIPRIVEPGDLVQQIRQHLTSLPARFQGPSLA